MIISPSPPQTPPLSTILYFFNTAQRTTAPATLRRNGSYCVELQCTSRNPTRAAVRRAISPSPPQTPPLSTILHSFNTAPRTTELQPSAALAHTAWSLNALPVTRVSTRNGKRLQFRTVVCIQLWHFILRFGLTPQNWIIGCYACVGLERRTELGVAATDEGKFLEFQDDTTK